MVEFNWIHNFFQSYMYSAYETPIECYVLHTAVREWIEVRII